MIQLKKLFTPVSSLDAQAAKTYMARHPQESFTLLDVRQPGEYQEEHLPGAKLIPLPQLGDAREELDPKKPTLVYCAIGGRSRVAAQMLSGWGFPEVYNLSGGIKAYQGEKATGPYELNLDLVRGDETPGEAVSLAYGMEQALKIFYQTMRDKTEDQELQSLFATLAQVEERHQERLRELYRQIAPTGPDLPALETTAGSSTMEGGFDLHGFMKKNEPYLNTVPHVLDLAMMLETQALDLYLRFADRTTQAPTREVWYRLVAEEKAHLASLGRLLEEKVTGP